MVKGTQPAVQVTVNAETKEAQRQVNDLTKKLGDMERKMLRADLAARAISKAFAVTGNAIKRFAGFAARSVDLAIKQEEVERALLDTVRRREVFTRRDFEQLQKQNNARQQSIGIGDEEQLKLQANAAALGINADQLDAVTRRTYALVDASGGSSGLSESLKKVVKMMRGSSTELQEIGIKTREAGDGLAYLDEHFSIMKSRGGTTSQLLKTLSANFGDLMESIGNLVIDQPSAPSVLGQLNKSILLFKTAIEDPAFIGRINGFSSVLLKMGYAATAAATGLYALFTGADAADAEVKAMMSFAKTLEKAIVESEKIARDPDYYLRGAGKPKPKPKPKPAVKPGAGFEFTGSFSTDKKTGPITPEEKAAIIGRQKDAARLRQELEDREALELYERNKRKRHRREQSFAEEEEAEAARLERYAEGREYWRQLNQESEDRRVQDKIDSDFAVEQMEADHWGRMIDVAATGAVMLAETIGAGLVTGEMNAKKALGSFAAMVLSTLGDLFISLGTAVIVGGKASTVLPFLSGIFGGPVGVGTGIALIGAGAVLKGAAAGISAYANKPTEQANQAKSAAASSRRNERRTAQGRPMPVTGGGPMVVHVNFNQPIGSPRKAARAIHDTLRAGGTLQPNWGPGY